jgi:hypothetical protein
MATSVAAAFAPGIRDGRRRDVLGKTRPFWNRPSPAAERCRDGPIAFVCMDWRHAGELAAASKIVLAELKDPLRVEQVQRRNGEFLPLQA